MPIIPRLFPLLALPLVAACAGGMDFDQTGGVRITRSACPATAIPTQTGDITLFDPPNSRDARAIDVTAAISNLVAQCGEVGDKIRSTLSFDVHARRSDAGGARDVSLPYFAVVTRAGTQIAAKQTGNIVLRFEDGQNRASATTSVTAEISRAAATIPEDVSRKINRRRKAGDEDAAIDPMSDPAVRATVARASFELLVGFQLTRDQLAYNATR